MNLPICVVEAEAFGDTITVTETYDYHSNPTGPPAAGDVTITGTATFVYGRRKLTDLGAKAKLAFEDLGALPVLLPKGSFLAVRGGTGRMPGWIVLVQDPDPQTGVFTTTTLTSGDGSTPPTVSHADATCQLTAVCTQSSPGRFILPPAAPGFLTLVNGVVSGTAQGTACTVELIQAGIAATNGSPVVLPVYRVTAPGSPGPVQGFSAATNGGAVTPYPTGPDAQGALAGGLSHLGDGGNLGGGYTTVVSRSPNVAEVQMPRLSDTLTSVSFGFYTPQNAVPATITAVGSDGGAQFLPDDPFHLSGQSYTPPDDGSGFSVTISL